MVYLGKNKVRDMNIGAKAELFRLAQKKRSFPTEAEKILWDSIRKFRKEGYIFRRQHPIDFFIADFYCHKLKLIIEVDGDIHSSEEAQDYDENRTGELERFGIKVIRFKNEDILNNLESVIIKIRHILKIQPPPLSWERGTGGGEAKKLKLKI
jgi:very-short-patch-repair endonuclease